jgi:hypothetical protein
MFCVLDGLATISGEPSPGLKTPAPTCRCVARGQHPPASRGRPAFKDPTLTEFVNEFAHPCRSTPPPAPRLRVVSSGSPSTRFYPHHSAATARALRILDLLFAAGDRLPGATPSLEDFPAADYSPSLHVVPPAADQSTT